MTNQLQQTALGMLHLGHSVIPVGEGKRPMVKWKPYQIRAMNPVDVQTYWAGNDNTDPGIGVVCGAVSSNLEMLELEGRACDPSTLEQLDTAMSKRRTRTRWLSLLKGWAERSPSGGLHLFYMLDSPVPGNEVIAATEGGLVLAETRGEGGYSVIAPTPGRFTNHRQDSANGWERVSRNVNPPLLTRVQRDQIHAVIAQCLDRRKPDRAQPTACPAVTEYGDDSPLNWFNRETTWAQILEPYGWRWHSSGAGGEQYWTRPGKSPAEGYSASANYQGSHNLYVFSTSTGLPTAEPLSRSYVYAHYNYSGNMRALARDIEQARRNQQTGKA